MQADAQPAPFVGRGDEPEQQLGACVIERGEAEFVQMIRSLCSSVSMTFPTMLSASAR